MASFKKGDKLDLSKLKRTKFTLKEISDSTYITLRPLTAPEVDLHIADGPNGESKNATAYKILSLVAEDDDGKPLFESEDDCRANLDITAQSLRKLLDTVMEISGIAPEKDRAKN